MKKIILATVYFLSLSAMVFSQNTYVPDDNFEYYLETHDSAGNNVPMGDSNAMGNGVMDDYVPTSKINSVVTLEIPALQISDLTGIEDFTALESLNCSANQLQSLDVSNNSHLRWLYCSNNQLTTLNISQINGLIYLYCNGNQLTSLDVSQHTNLQRLYCQQNQLSTIDISHNTALLHFFCSNNQLTQIDISQNSNLVYFSCSYNQLSTIDVLQNTNLSTLDCKFNSLTSLDVSSNTNLRQLDCAGNQISSLDVSNNPDLRIFYCYNNQLTDLDMRNGSNTLLSTFNATGNPNLTCVFVDDANYMNTTWPNAIDNTAHYVETQAECDALEIHNPSSINRIKLYPVPTGNQLTIESSISGHFQLIDKTGKIISEGYIRKGINRISVKHLEKGIYFLLIKYNKNNIFQKLIIK